MVTIALTLTILGGAGAVIFIDMQAMSELQAAVRAYEAHKALEHAHKRGNRWYI